MTQSVLFLQHYKAGQFFDEPSADPEELGDIASRMLQQLGIRENDKEPAFELVTASIGRFYRLARIKHDLILVLCDYTRRRQKLWLITLSALLRAQKKCYLFKRDEYHVISGTYLCFLTLKRPFLELVSFAMKLLLRLALFLLSKKRNILSR